MNLGPGIRTFIAETAAAYDDEAEFASVEQQRPAYMAFAKRYDRGRPPGVAATNRVVPAPQGEIPVRLFRPGYRRPSSSSTAAVGCSATSTATTTSPLPRAVRTGPRMEIGLESAGNGEKASP